MELSSEKSSTEQKDGGCWQDPIEDVKEMIVKRMSFSGRVRLSSLCKSWRLVSMRKDIPVPPQLPWLVHFQADPSWDVESYLNFSSLSEDNKIFKLTLPTPLFESNCPRELYASSKGWLIMLKKNKSTVMQSFVFLVNPITGTQHLLPSLKTIPSYKPDSKQSNIIHGFVLSSPDISECTVAAVINQREMALCRPSVDKRWTLFPVLGEDDNLDEIYIDILMFSSSGVLYALVMGLNAGVNADLHLKFGDHNVEFKLIYFDADWLIGDMVGMNPPPPDNLLCTPFLLESINNEVLLICQIFIRSPDVNEEEGNNNGEQGEENNEENNEQPHTNLTRTSFFRVYKIDPDNNNNYRGHRVENLGDQIVFVADDTSSAAVSLPATDFKDLRGNCIYFATRESCSDTPQLTHYMGIFYLDSGKIERSEATLEVPDNLRELCWFTPSLW